MSDLRIEPTGATLGAIVTGIDLANLDPAEWAEIEPAFHEYAVLIFPGQHLTDVAQTTFGARFGELAIDFLPFSNLASRREPARPGRFTDEASERERGLAHRQLVHVALGQGVDPVRAQSAAKRGRD